MRLLSRLLALAWYLGMLVMLGSLAGCAALHQQIQPVPAQYVNNDLAFEPTVIDMLEMLEAAEAAGCQGVPGLTPLTLTAMRDALREWALTVHAAAEDPAP